MAVSVTSQSVRPQQAPDHDTDLVERVAAGSGTEARQHIDGAGVTAISGGDQMDPSIPMLGNVAEIQAGFADRLQDLRHLATTRQKEVPILERLQSRTQIKTRPMGKGHAKIGVYMDKSTFC